MVQLSDAKSFQGFEPREPILVEREGTHGVFELNAQVWEALWKGVIPYKSRFTKEHELILNMIFLKLARITQQPNIKDHWKDIAGYASLGAEACDRK